MPDTAISFVEDFRAELGEGLLWSPREQALYWLDTVEKKIIRTRPPFTTSEVRDLHYRPSSLALHADGGLLIAYKKGIGRYDFDTGTATSLPLSGVDFSVVSFNDGACDRAGNFWIGTRHRDASEPVGTLYKLGGDLGARPMVEGLILSNGMAWSPDANTFYHVDSRPGRIDAYDFDPETSMLSGRRIFVDYQHKGGSRPDGCTVDTEGYLWVAEIDGWRVARYAPDGSLDREIMLPMQKPSNVAFGGKNFETMFVTSISAPLSAEQRLAQPGAGKLMLIDAGVRGLAENIFRR
ncbi:MAG TPA: SMP-30/gluconolactonase/LRE family protein [Devosiaceae bacterium]|jgi:sugar lactone lactonase YvrE